MTQLDNPTYPAVGKTKYSEQTIQNFGFDEKYKIPIRLSYTYNAELDRLEPVNDIQGNASFEYTVGENSCQINMTIGSVVYRKTISWESTPYTETTWIKL